jgi:hypothetical protein
MQSWWPEYSHALSEFSLSWQGHPPTQEASQSSKDDNVSIIVA